MEAKTREVKITVFTIPKPFEGHIGTIQRNAIQSWCNLKPRPDVILFGDEKGVGDAAEYFKTFEYILTHIHNLEFMNMGATFISNRNEDRIRGIPQERKRGRVMCWRLSEPNYFMMPNGDVFLCCMTRGISDKIGSLQDCTYPELVARFNQISTEMQTDTGSVCHYCTASIPWYLWQLVAIKKKVLGKFFGAN